MTERKNIVYLSRIRAFACIAVVILHTFYAFDSFAQKNSEHIIMLSVRNLMMWAVPCFVMVTGALLLDKKRKTDLKKIFGNYIMRMVTALILFSLLFAVFDSLVMNKPMSQELVSGLKNIAFGTGWKHMWYLYMMIALYLLLPVYKAIVKSSGKTEIIYLLAVYTVFMSLLPTVQTITGKTTAFYICSYTIYPFFLFLGYAMHSRLININPVVSYLLVILSAVIISVMTALSCKNGSPEITELLENYSFPVFIAGSAGIYSLFRLSEKKDFKIIDSILLKIDGCSFGIYLIHMAVLKFIIVKLQFNPFLHGGTISVILITIGIFIISFALVYILKMIPYVKKVL